ncbi:hypothetical protein ASG40_19420 [Methylobacterium sp. Leaf399]|uniref:hypothetical protein n=1 Tax=Methylobacterium sp. Leaf399 TaxID=1736364 RepID=UPI0006F7E803|nr:hypothetical protein [Methylobacterium sp. Leaf399]KQT13998.1 hypothetical protein ASG40_19420 [Methylobacterium sp. Leaf399]
MALTPEQQAALTRLLSLYNNAAYDPDANPGGLANGGHRPNFTRALADIALAGAGLSALTTEAATAIGQALTAYGSSGALTAAVADAVAARNAAQAAVGGGRVGRDTFADVGGVAGTGLVSSLNYPDGAIGEVFTGAGAGYYVKSGASGTGSWIKKDDNTIPGLAVRTQAYPVTKLISEDILRYLSDILGRFDDLPGYSWAGPRDALGQTPLAVGLEGDVVLRDLRIVAAPSDSGYSWALIGLNGVAPLAVADDGLVWLRLSPKSWIDSYRNAYLPPETVIALGAPGNPFETCRDGDFLRYRSGGDGAALPYVIRTDRAGGPSILDTPEMEAAISYGQSWRSMNHYYARETFYDADRQAVPPTIADMSEAQTVMTLARAGGPISPVGAPFETSAIVDLIGLKMSTGANIGYVASQTLAKLRRGARRYQRPILEFCHAYPGFTWPQLRPGAYSTTSQGSISPWQEGLNMIAAARAQAARYGKTIRFRSVGFTHAAAADGSPGDMLPYYSSLAEMVASYDALALNGPGGDPLHFFIDQTAASIGLGKAQGSYLEQVQFAVDNAARVHLIGPRFPYGFIDDIHHDAFATVRIGELEGLVKHKVLDLGQSWDCARITSVVPEGGGFTFNVTRPSGFDDLAFDTTQIKEFGDKGFQLRVAGAAIPISQVTLTANKVRVIPVTMPSSGTNVEASHAFYGRADTATATHSPAWGNVKRLGPPSIYFPKLTVDTWVCAYRSTVTV